MSSLVVTIGLAQNGRPPVEVWDCNPADIKDGSCITPEQGRRIREQQQRARDKAEAERVAREEAERAKPEFELKVLYYEYVTVKRCYDDSQPKAIEAREAMKVIESFFLKKYPNLATDKITDKIWEEANQAPKMAIISAYACDLPLKNILRARAVLEGISKVQKDF
jgi:hypothetical protein